MSDRKYIATIKLRVKAATKGDALYKARDAVNYGIIETSATVAPSNIKLLDIDAKVKQ